jgi:hypothetical protein
MIINHFINHLNPIKYYLNFINHLKTNLKLLKNFNINKGEFMSGVNIFKTSDIMGVSL